jgi:hypothetical protein
MNKKIQIILFVKNKNLLFFFKEYLNIFKL